jgi:hypothetical protein
VRGDMLYFSDLLLYYLRNTLNRGPASWHRLAFSPFDSFPYFYTSFDGIELEEPSLPLACPITPNRTGSQCIDMITFRRWYNAAYQFWNSRTLRRNCWSKIAAIMIMIGTPDSSSMPTRTYKMSGRHRIKII